MMSRFPDDLPEMCHNCFWRSRSHNCEVKAGMPCSEVWTPHCLEYLVIGEAFLRGATKTTVITRETEYHVR